MAKFTIEILGRDTVESSGGKLEYLKDVMSLYPGFKIPSVGSDP
jgi:hypothetical protein